MITSYMFYSQRKNYCLQILDSKRILIYLLSVQFEMEFQKNISTTPESRNSTHETTTQFYDYELEWIFCEALTIPFALLALYLTITQIFFSIRKQKAIMPGRRISSSSTSASNRQSSANASQQHVLVLNLLLIFSSFCALCRAGIDFRLAYGRFNDFGCDLAIKFKLAFYALGIIASYMVLWLRQRIFYQNPRLVHLSSRFVRFLSWSMSIFIIVGLSSTAVLFFAVGKYLGTPQGCVVQESFVTKIRWYILIISTTFFQIALMSLFIYPLIKHHLSLKSIKISSNQKNPIIPMIKRSTIMAALCIGTDLFSAFIVVIRKQEVVTMSTFLYDVNIVMNVFFVILSFPDWKLRIMPWNMTQYESQTTEESATTSSRNITGETNM